MVTTLRHDNHTVRVDDGELIAYLVDTREYIHQKGSPGWRSSDTEMFPVIGPTAEADFRVETPRGQATQDQHGLLREMSYDLTEASETRAVFTKVYRANTEIKNSKYPAKSTAEDLSWPYDFRFRKTFTLGADGLTVGFEIGGEPGMPFMLGYHPAFRLASDAVTIEANGETIALADVIKVGDRAYRIPDCTELTLRDGKEGVVRLRTEGFGDFMLWAPVDSMICLEPITFYPYAVAQSELHQGFRTLGDGSAEFEVHLRPQ